MKSPNENMLYNTFYCYQLLLLFLQLYMLDVLDTSSSGHRQRSSYIIIIVRITKLGFRTNPVSKAYWICTNPLICEFINGILLYKWSSVTHCARSANGIFVMTKSPWSWWIGYRWVIGQSDMLKGLIIANGLIVMNDKVTCQSRRQAGYKAISWWK